MKTGKSTGITKVCYTMKLDLLTTIRIFGPWQTEGDGLHTSRECHTHQRIKLNTKLIPLNFDRWSPRSSLFEAAIRLKVAEL